MYLLIHLTTTTTRNHSSQRDKVVGQRDKVSPKAHIRWAGTPKQANQKK